jgi:hypothetical protein
MDDDNVIIIFTAKKGRSNITMLRSITGRHIYYVCPVHALETGSGNGIRNGSEPKQAKPKKKKSRNNIM